MYEVYDLGHHPTKAKGVPLLEVPVIFKVILNLVLIRLLFYTFSVYSEIQPTINDVKSSDKTKSFPLITKSEINYEVILTWITLTLFFNVLTRVVGFLYEKYFTNTSDPRSVLSRSVGDVLLLLLTGNIMFYIVTITTSYAGILRPCFQDICKPLDTSGEFWQVRCLRIVVL